MKKILSSGLFLTTVNRIPGKCEGFLKIPGNFPKHPVTFSWLSALDKAAPLMVHYQAKWGSSRHGAMQLSQHLGRARALV